MQIKSSEEKPRELQKSGAHLVAAGILFSRVSGLVRQWIFARFFGNSDAGDAFYAALRITNFLQNLLGEGILSASFIPVYARLRGQKKDDEADQVARVIGSVLALATAVLVLGGVLLTRQLIDLIAPGFVGEKRELTIQLVQIFFPGTGLLVMSAWCLGILNSHRKFFLSYAAPVIWNAAIIGALLLYGRSSTKNDLAIDAAWGLVVGSALQFGVQIPSTFGFLKRWVPDLSVGLQSVRTVFHNFVPVVITRGVVQVSAYIDSILASFLPTGAVSALAYAQSLYMLPISLFGMSVAVAELPTMSQATGSTDEITGYMRTRIDAGLQQISFFIVPAVVGFLALGDVIVGALYQSGQFTADDSRYVWTVLAGSTIGLLASTMGRLYSSGFYSLQDTRTPLKFAAIRVVLTTILGYVCGLKLPLWLGYDPRLGTAGLTASAGFAGWVEFLLLRRALNKQVGNTGVPIPYLAKLWTAALAAGAVGFALRLLVTWNHPMLRAIVVLLPFGVVYLGITLALGLDQARRFLRLKKRG